MEFSRVGGRCSVKSCNLQDFLPFKCEGCNKTFCLNHRATNQHDCPRPDFGDNKVFKCPICLKVIRIVPDEDINMTWARHASKDCDPRRREKQRKAKKKNRCRMCKAKLNAVNKMHCERCGLDFCVKHRLPSNHRCGEKKKKKKSASIPKVSCTRIVTSSPPTLTNETCPQCGAQFPSVESLVIHFQQAHDTTTKPKKGTRKKSCIVS